MEQTNEERQRLRELWSTYPPKESMDLLRSQLASDSTFDEDRVDDAYLALDLINHFRLVVRPDLFNGVWCGRFKSITLDGKKMEYEMETVVWSPEIPLAVFWASLRTIEADKGVI